MVGNKSSLGSLGEILDENFPIEINGSIENLSRKAQNALPLVKKHKFGETQPVGQFKDIQNRDLSKGPIEDPTPLSEVRKEPYNLPSPYEWCTCDINKDETSTQIYNLLTKHYVEDNENMFRFDYSKDFLRWALRSLGYFKSWHIGVQVYTTSNMVSFIIGVPARIKI